MASFTKAQTFTTTNLTINRHVDGTLLVPESVEHPPLVIILLARGLPTEMATNPS